MCSLSILRHGLMEGKTPIHGSINEKAIKKIKTADSALPAQYSSGEKHTRSVIMIPREVV